MKSINSHKRRGIASVNDAKRSLRGSMTLPLLLTPMTPPRRRMLKVEPRSAIRVALEILRILMDTRAKLRRTRSFPEKGLNAPSFIIVIEVHTRRICLRFKIKILSL